MISGLSTVSASQSALTCKWQHVVCVFMHLTILHLPSWVNGNLLWCQKHKSLFSQKNTYIISEIVKISGRNYDLPLHGDRRKYLISVCLLQLFFSENCSEYIYILAAVSPVFFKFPIYLWTWSANRILILLSGIILSGPRCSKGWIRPIGSHLGTYGLIELTYLFWVYSALASLVLESVLLRKTSLQITYYYL